MLDRARAALDDWREFWAFWKALPRKPKTKGWGALGGLSNEEIDEVLAEAWDNVPRDDVEIWCAEPEPEPEQAA